MPRTTISVGDLREMLDHGEPVTVLDIRPVAERAEWAIPGSVHLDAYKALKAQDPHALEGIDLPSYRPVVTVCGAGKTSMIAAEQLRTKGFEAASLEGGMKAWSLAWNAAEVPVERSQARIFQMRRTGKGCLSYVVGSDGEAFVIDAALEPAVYVELAEKHGWKIVSVLETHIHADHLSRSRKLAELSGATLYLPEQNRVSYPFVPVPGGDALRVGAARLEALYTPGHTMESTSYLLDERALFTGDTLFTTAVGRPDLDADLEGAKARAKTLYSSLQRILTLPSETLILPGHTSEPVAFDGEMIGSTLAEVGKKAEVLRLPEDAFVEKITAHLPPTPANYRRVVELNEAGQLPEGDLTDLEAGANRCAAG
jgi:glyoxylase-like metal-dependent hydrolase (beta-lactamase superfamily II)